MENFRTTANGFRKVSRANGQNHKFLDIDIIVGMLTAIDDIHHRHGHAVAPGAAIQLRKVFIQGQALGLGCGLGEGQRHSQNRVGAELGFIFSTVQVKHLAVQGPLVFHVETK